LILNSRLEVAYCVHNHQKQCTPNEDWKISTIHGAQTAWS
jgi:hypothetical protein